MLFKPADICTLAKELKQGAIGVFPCDTLIGIVAAVTPASIRRIQHIKQRPDSPFLVLLPNWQHLSSWAAPLEAHQTTFLQNIWPGPVSCLLPKHENVSNDITANSPYIGVRIPNFLPLNLLLNQTGMPLLSTSLNRHGEAPVQHLDTCPKELLTDLDFVYKDCVPRYNYPSTIIKLNSCDFSIVRQGIMKFTCLSYTKPGHHLLTLDEGAG
ncbi:Sua5/YciO/YrdC/YwlC family protein [bacterium]|nr:Sua5/YciO/YrdC/YwlC family protein [bacterium]